MTQLLLIIIFYYYVDGENSVKYVSPFSGMGTMMTVSKYVQIINNNEINVFSRIRNAKKINNGNSDEGMRVGRFMLSIR